MSKTKYTLKLNRLLPYLTQKKDISEGVIIEALYDEVKKMKPKVHIWADCFLNSGAKSSDELVPTKIWDEVGLEDFSFVVRLGSGLPHNKHSLGNFTVCQNEVDKWFEQMFCGYIRSPVSLDECKCFLVQLSQGNNNVIPSRDPYMEQAKDHFSPRWAKINDLKTAHQQIKAVAKQYGFSLPPVGRKSRKLSNE